MTDALFAPLRVGPVELPNRIVSTSHQTGLVHDHRPTPALLAYHAERAAGGVGAVFVEAAAVHPSGLINSHTLAAYQPQSLPGLAALADAVHAHGTPLLLQLMHGGSEEFSGAPRSAAPAPSAVPSPRFRVEPRALTLREIRAIVRGYADAARHAVQAGFDGVEVSAAHGYLPAQFMSPLTNHRADAYAAPLRFTTEVLRAVREAIGADRALSVRLAADELTPGGLDNARCLEIAEELAPLVDCVSLALGYSRTLAGSSWIAPPPPVAEDVILTRLGGLRERLPRDVRLLATTRIVDPVSAAGAVARGLADAVGMTRALIADPHLPRKLRAGVPAIPCIGCNQSCIGHYHEGLPIGCAVNVRTGREATLPQRPDRPPRERRLPVAGRARPPLLVVGAGPAGVAAAVEAGYAGRRVLLVERAEGVGGQLWLAGRAPAHRESARRWYAWAERELLAAGVDLRLGTDAAQTLEEFAAESEGVEGPAIVLAAGAVPYRPELPVPPGLAMVDAWTAIGEPERLPPPGDGAVLVADWGGGWCGPDAAEVLAASGREVLLACAAPVPGMSLHQYQRNGYLARLDALGVRLLPHLELVADPEEGTELTLRHVFSGRLEGLPEDVSAVVVAHGRVPQDELWARLEGRPGAVRAGDVRAARSLEEAVLEGTRAVLAVPAP
ncbi:oxidoreductase [Streptacidiphilus rugosus]|uniref:oxidoreductase n=1 Tax=Streptacidiphilus rugosus TaxID=405783 RepID=UPI00068FDAFA|nr:FAD-dependent oxidoreductase [Streptacidiphilus rugosus]